MQEAYGSELRIHLPELQELFLRIVGHDVFVVIFRHQRLGVRGVKPINDQKNLDNEEVRTLTEVEFG